MLQLLNSLPKDLTRNVLSEYLEYDEIYDLKKYIKNLRFNLKRIKVYEIESVYGGILDKIRYRDYMNFKNIISEESWDANGVKTREVNYTSSHITYLEFYNDVSKKTEYRFNNQTLKLDGMHYNWYQNGNLHYRVSYKNGVQDGKSYMWHQNGDICSEMNYKDGNLDGKQYHWNLDGKKWMQLSYKNNIKDGEWIIYKNNKVQKTYYIDGYISLYPKFDRFLGLDKIYPKNPKN